MKSSLVSNCERNFLLKALNLNTRIDNRNFEDVRSIDIQFKKDWGSVLVSLGQTRVLANVSCSIKQPKITRPNEGLLFIDVQFSPIVGSLFEKNQSENEIEISRILEKCFVDSKMLDLESLCIKSGEKVFALRVDINALNHDGNLIDCSSIAVLCALSHFRRPDFSIVDGNTVIFTQQERDPIPLHLHHSPLTLTYCLLSDGEYIIADPNLLEEYVSNGKMIFGINNYSEVCSLFFGGGAQIDRKTIIKYAQTAARNIEDRIMFVKNAVKNDIDFRNTKIKIET